jgi:Skp family chaperone for outer membrane proteins
MKPMLVLLAASALGLSLPGHADTVFKWVDGNGVTNYTTTPPPPSVNKVAAVNAAPAISSSYPSAGDEEAQYWRQRRLREAGDNLQNSRLRQESEDLRQARIRQDMALRDDEERRRKAEEQRRQAAFEQCQRERRVECDGYGYGAPVFVARHRPQPITSVAPFPVPGSPLVTNPTPGAPSPNTWNPTPGAGSLGTSTSSNVAPSRPAAEPRRGVATRN